MASSPVTRLREGPRRDTGSWVTDRKQASPSPDAGGEAPEAPSPDVGSETRSPGAGGETRSPGVDGEAPEADGARARRAELRRMLLRVLVILLLFFALIAFLARTFREPLRVLGTSFVERFGTAGLFVGTFAADAFSVPIPPQVYMLTAITSGRPQLISIGAICAASLLAGMTGFWLGGHLTRIPFFLRLLDRSRAGFERLMARWGPWAVFVACFSPLPYSGLCYTAGLYGMPRRLFAAFVLLRVPRLLLFYAALRAGWLL